MYDSFTTVESNYFDRCNGEIEIISSKSCENIYRYNVFVSCEGNLTLRHGNRCSIYGNYFFCNAASNSGGIRIIGEDHKVYNNYIENSAGSSMKTGITLTNGVPNSPLNRYFQVKRALIVFNTLIGNRYSFNIGAGKDSELSLPPSDCVIANNLVWSTKSPLITYTDTPINMNYAGNIFYGATLGISKPEGIEIVDPKISFTTDSLWRLTGDSPAIDSALGSYPFVTVDVDGQPRVAPFDIGADEYSSATITQRPIRKNEVGPAGVVTSVKKGLVGQIPREFGIIRNYPNPFNPTTTIDFTVVTAGKAALRVYNVIGEEVAFLFNGDVLAGQIYHSTFDAGRLPSGLYVARLESGNSQLAQKMLLMK
jgi:poly(beta-D-mannuronate) lyase